MTKGDNYIVCMETMMERRLFEAQKAGARVRKYYRANAEIVIERGLLYTNGSSAQIRACLKSAEPYYVI